MERHPGISVPVPQLLREQGFKSGTRVSSVQVITPDPEISERLGLSQNEEVVELCRVRLADGEPLSFEQAYLSTIRFPGLADLDLHHSLLEILRNEYGVEAYSTSERIEMIGASRQHARMLGIRTGEPIFFITRWTADCEGRGVEFSRDYFRADRTQLFVHSKRNFNATSTETCSDLRRRQC
jgi:GntR family transcriptional regulator